MHRIKISVCLSLLCLTLASCNKETATNPTTSTTATPVPAASVKPLAEWTTGYRVYVTNEKSGDLTVIDGATLEVISQVPLGKRPRGIHASPDNKLIYVALSGSPMAPPGVDESTLPPPDKSADGIGIFDVAQNKIIRIIPGGSDP